MILHWNLKGMVFFLRITVVKEFKPHPFTVLGLRINDIDTKVKSLTKQGVEFVRYTALI